MRRNVEQAVVVVTGASSGIGRATALELARRGATVLLAARREEPLERLARECDERGGRGVAVPTDVRDAEAVDRLAAAAVDRFGKLDAWVNNAATILFARFGEEPVDEARRVIEVNVLGYLHGARAALPRFRDRGRGVLVNVGSVLSRIPSPYLASYVMSKHAIRALSRCLRTELLDAPAIRVCTVLPGAVDTPLFDHAANHTGWALQPLRPTYPPQRVARAVVSCLERPRDEVFVGMAARLSALGSALAPGTAERLAGRVVHRGHFTDQPADPTSGNLFAPVAVGDTASGGWRGGTTPVARRVAIAGSGLMLGLLVGRRRG